MTEAHTRPSWSDGFAGLGHLSGEGGFPTVGDIYAEAQRRLERAVWDFLDGGAGDEVTVAGNRASFAGWQFLPQLLSGIEAIDTRTSFLGIPLAFPLLTSPFGADRLFHDEGHLAVARANQAFGAASIVPEASSFSLERIAAEAPAAARIFQLHPIGPVENFRRMAGRAADAGYQALCLTLDCPTGGWRERNMRNQFSPELPVIGGNYGDGRELADMLSPETPIWDWKTVEREMAAIGLPFMAKGILTVQDARRAVDAGASAVLVSNHGGRQLDGAPPALDQLPEIASEVGREAAVALDSGIRRGADIVKALALGADVVVIGRAAAMALAADGEQGVLRLLTLLRDETVNIMRITGRPDIQSLDRTLLQRARA
jgi:4-hydroxymandelate oxidase